MEPLLHTKLYIPPVRRAAVERARLLQRIQQGVQGALTLVSAPAGFGKTTLIAAWAAQAGFPVGWLSLDAEDNDPVRFLAYLAAVLEKVQPGVSPSMEQLLASPEPPPIQAGMKTLVNALGSLNQPGVIVLDDYHFISAAAIHEGIAFLLDHLPTNLHLLIATRSDPPVPLARLRSRGQLLELRAGDLAFTPEEAAEFLSQVMGLTLSAEDIATLENRTEGWIAGLQMAAISMQGRSDIHAFIQAFSGSHRYILDYLAEEALNRQPQAVQRFLRLTSIFDRMCAPLCSALTGDGEVVDQAMLEYLERANLFLVALDDERRWFRYHHLFADLLRARLGQSLPGEIQQLHLRAAHWLEANGLVVEAVQHAFSAHDYARAAELIERYGPSDYTSSDRTILLQMGSLPAEWLTDRPKLGIYQAWFWVGSGRIQAALPLLNRLKERLAAAETTPDTRWMRSIVDLSLAFITYRVDQPTATTLPDTSAFDLMSQQDQGLRSAADMLYAMLLSRRGEFDRAAEILLGSVQRDMAAGGTTAIPSSIPFLARIRLGQGRLREAAALCRDYLRPATQKGISRLYGGGSLNIVLGEVLREWNDLEQSEEQIREGMRANELWDNIVSDMIGYAALVRVLLAKGDLDAALETLHRLEERLEGRTLPVDQMDELRTLRARIWLAQGDLTRAGALADAITLIEPPDPRQELDRLTLARVRLAQKRYAEALPILESLSQLAAAKKWANRQIKTDLLRAEALAGLDQPQPALEILESCLALGEPDNHLRVFLDSGPVVRELLNAYLRTLSPQHKPYARRILDAFSGPPSGAAFRPDAESSPEHLTRRELEVLRWMAEGRSNRQIAVQLFLSEGTVKYHVHSILEKMQVDSRAQAVAKAKRLGLFKNEA